MVTWLAADDVAPGTGAPRPEFFSVAGWGPSVRDNAMSTSEITLPPAVVTTARGRRRLPMALLAVGILLVALFIVASIVTVPYDELVPGQAQAVSRLITVPPGKGHPLHGRVLLTDVGLIENLHLIALLPAWLDGDATLIKTSELTGNLPQAEFNDQGTVDMEESQLTAKAVALRQLGYPIPESDAGATVYGLDPGTPGYRSLKVGDVITAVDGVATPDPTALVAAIRSHTPGQTVTLQVGSVAHPTPGRSVSLRLASARQNGKVVPLVGIVEMGTQPVYQLAFPISINSDQIGGPSAGLAWTLGIVNTLSGGHLTGGRTIAASGTIRPDGGVGDVGGVAQKTVAVERAGATVFFVPDVEVAVARSKATPDLKVYGVSSLGQALRDLQTLGGHLGRPVRAPRRARAVTAFRTTGRTLRGREGPENEDAAPRWGVVGSGACPRTAGSRSRRRPACTLTRWPATPSAPLAAASIRPRSGCSSSRSPVRWRRGRPGGGAATVVEEAERHAANPVLDEATLTAALGQETARVLRSAHDAASELVAKARSRTPPGCAPRLRTRPASSSHGPSRTPLTGSPKPRRWPPTSVVVPRKR